MTEITQGDVERALLLLPEPYFRNRDIYDVAIALGMKAWMGQTLWGRLKRDGLIVRTAIPIVEHNKRGGYVSAFYWERTRGSR